MQVKIFSFLWVLNVMCIYSLPLFSKDLPTTMETLKEIHSNDIQRIDTKVYLLPYEKKLLVDSKIELKNVHEKFAAFDLSPFFSRENFLEISWDDAPTAQTTFEVQKRSLVVKLPDELQNKKADKIILRVKYVVTDEKGVNVIGEDEINASFDAFSFPDLSSSVPLNIEFHATNGMYAFTAYSPHCSEYDEYESEWLFRAHSFLHMTQFAGLFAMKEKALLKEIDDVKYCFLGHPPEQPFFEEILKVLPDAMKAFKTQWGFPYGHQLNIIIVTHDPPEKSFVVGPVGNIVFVGAPNLSLPEKTMRFKLAITLPHELSHLLFAAKITNNAAKPGSVFLNESMAEYSSYLMTEKLYGIDFSKQRRFFWNFLYMAHKKKVEDNIPLSVLAGIQFRFAYSKGAYALHTLRSLLGTNKFVGLFKYYVKSNTGKTVSFKNFEDVFKNETRKYFDVLFKKNYNPDHRIVGIEKKKGFSRVSYECGKMEKKLAMLFRTPVGSKRMSVGCTGKKQSVSVKGDVTYALLDPDVEVFDINIFNNAYPRPGFLGISFTDVLFVDELHKTSSISRDRRVGSTLISINGKKIYYVTELMEWLLSTRVGQTVETIWMKDGKNFSVDIELVARPTEKSDGFF